MTAIEVAVSDPTIPRLADDETARVRVTQGRVLGSEFLKLRTLRSTYVTLAITIASMAGIGTIIAWSTANDWLNMRPRRRLRFDPLQDSLTGFQLAQLAIGVFGVLMIASEYSTGMIRSSLAGVPKRLPMLWAKVTVAITVALVTMVPSALFAFFASQRLLSVRGIQTSWSAPDVPRTVLGVALYLTVVAVIGVGLGAIMRNVAGAIATLVGVLLVLPVIALALPDTWAERINKYLPSNAGQALLGGQSDTTTLAPWTGFAVFVGYAVVTIGIAAVLLRRRDA